MTNQCDICGRDLTASDSVARGCGPICAAKRETFVAKCGTTEEELAALEACCDDAAKWIRNFRTDMRHGRTRQAKQCIEFARYKAANVQASPVKDVAVTAADTGDQEAEPFITVRQIERGGFYVHTPFHLVGFVDAFKRVVGGTWHPEKEAWYCPASQLTWTIEALEYWFGLEVRVEPFSSAPAMFTPAEPPSDKPSSFTRSNRIGRNSASSIR